MKGGQPSIHEVQPEVSRERQPLGPTKTRFGLLSFNVTRCRYAEMYRSLGIAEVGALLSCNRDFSLVEGFNPDIALTRTQTIMQGASHCDFRFVARPAKTSPGG